MSHNPIRHDQPSPYGTSARNRIAMR